MKVLFAIDLTEPPFLTDAVQELARRMGAELLVLHVAEEQAAASHLPFDPFSGLAGYVPYAAFDPDVLHRMDRDEARAFEAFLTERFRMPVKPALRIGPAADVILNDADEHAADIIVVGRRPHSLLEEFFVGSVADDLIHRSGRPILVMPHPISARG